MKQNKRLIPADEIPKYCVINLREGRGYPRCMREILAGAKAHYEWQIQEANKATEAYGELKYDEGLLEGVDKAHKACDETYGEMLKEAIKAERERTLSEIDTIISWGEWDKHQDGTAFRDGHIMSEPWQALSEGGN